MVELNMKAAGIQPHSIRNHNPDFAAIANSAGIKGIHVEKPGELTDAIRTALHHPGPVLLDVITDANALS